MEPVVTVGLDGHPESVAAAHWAAREAKLRQLPLRLMHAWVLLEPGTVQGAGADAQNYWARRILGDARKELADEFPDLPIIESLVPGDPLETLLTAGEESELLVIGSRGLGPLQSYFVGAIALHIVARATRPIVVVRAPTAKEAGAGTRGGGVTVGLDLLAHQDDVLTFAFEAADRRALPLYAVYGMSPPARAYAPWRTDTRMTDGLSADARKRMSEALRPWREKFRNVPVVESVRLESPARSLVGAASDADLLVVGRRRSRSGLAPRIGAVAHAALHHAPSPVAVVPYD